MSCIIADPGDRLGLNRGHYIPQMVTASVWTGLKFDGNGRPYDDDPDIMLLDGYRHEFPAFKSLIYFDRAEKAMREAIGHREATQPGRPAWTWCCC